MLKRAVVVRDQILAIPSSPLVSGCVLLSVFRDRSAIGLPVHTMTLTPSVDAWRYATAEDFESFNVHHHPDFTECTKEIAA